VSCDSVAGKVGIALNINWRESYSNSSADAAAAERALQLEVTYTNGARKWTEPCPAFLLPYCYHSTLTSVLYVTLFKIKKNSMV
jgi:hypothetical protein